MKNLQNTLIKECKKKYDEICSIKDISNPDTLFIGNALVPMINESINDIYQHSDAFVNKIAQKMIICIFEDIKIEIFREDSSSDTTILAAKNLLHIALADQDYKRKLEEILTFSCDYGFYPVRNGVTEW